MITKKAITLLTLLPVLSLSSPTPSNPQTSPQQPPPNDLGTWEYQGCFKDLVNNTRAIPNYSGPNNQTIQGCVYACTLRTVYTVIGLENGGQCFCGNSVPAQGYSNDPTECGMPCKGDATQVCGGKAVLSVYVNTGVLAPPPPTPTTPAALPPSVGGPALLLQQISYNPTTNVLTGSIYVADLTFNKRVSVEYYPRVPTFSPVPTLSIQTSYKSGVQGSRYQIWEFESPIIDVLGELKAQVRVEYTGFDSRGGSNYIVPPSLSEVVVNPNKPSEEDLGGLRMKSFKLDNAKLDVEVWVPRWTTETGVEVTISAPNSDFSRTRTFELQKPASGNETSAWDLYTLKEGDVAGLAGSGSAIYLKYTGIGYDKNGRRGYPILPSRTSPTTTTVRPTSTLATTTKGPTTTTVPTPSLGPVRKVVQEQEPSRGNKQVLMKEYTYDTLTGSLSGAIWLHNTNWASWSSLSTLRPFLFIFCSNSRGVFTPSPVAGAFNTTITPSKNDSGYRLFEFQNVKECKGGSGSQFYIQYLFDLQTLTPNGECPVSTCAKDTNGDYNYILPHPTRAAPEGWSKRTIYQILTDRFAPSTELEVWDRCEKLREYCGGSWKGVKERLGYIKSMGFDAVWISPIVMNTPKGYHGYWALDFYQLNPQFGTAEDLLDLITTAHSMGMYIMFDVVANHLGPWGPIETYPPPFNNASNFHPYCTISDSSTQLENEVCRLFGDLPDLNTEDPQTISELYKWIKYIMDTYKPDGLRIDTFRNVRKEFWPGFIESAGGVFSMGEAYGGDARYVGPWQGYAQSLLSYPMYFNVFVDVFGNKASMWQLEQQLVNDKAYFRDVSLLGTFLDNHDQRRFLNVRNDPAVLRNALALLFFTTGIPILYYGTEQSFTGGIDPTNREPLWILPQDEEPYTLQPNSGMVQYITFLNEARRDLADEMFWEEGHVSVYTRRDVHFFKRGNFLVGLTNLGREGGDVEARFRWPFGKEGVLKNVLKPWEVLKVDKRGWVSVVLKGGEPGVWYV
ncbi:Alpha-amylase A type-1/2 [Chytridiales sp. JEL 0842]|nr:Alpha-amylase A type-1/2 [Chytridiales sp. JEL 0842]